MAQNTVCTLQLFLIVQFIMMSSIRGLAQSSNYISKSKLLEQASRVRKQILSSYHPKEVNIATTSYYSPSDLYFASSYQKKIGGRRGLCNWLIPNYVMIGQYPGQNPERDGPTQAEVEQHIHRCVNDANVRLFCSLQSEVPAQDDYESWNSSNSNFAEGEVGRIQLPIGGGREDFPGYFTHYAPFVQNALMSEKTDSVRSSSSLSPSFIHAPIIDLNTPSSTSLLSLLSKILDNMDNSSVKDKINSEGVAHSKSSAIYIHCWGGRGRAGLVGACLISLIFPETTGEECLDWVQRGYDSRDGAIFMPLGLRRSPQTISQREFVLDFVKDTKENHL